MAITANLGFPRIGAQRELKKAQESYWKGELTLEQLLASAKAIRLENWKRHHKAGISHIPSGDFAMYDQVLNHSFMFSCIPARYESLKSAEPMALYFAMARGHQKDGVDVVACEMTKWFDTNYHYIVPEFSADTEFHLRYNQQREHFNEAKAAGYTTRPVVIGPVTYLSLGKTSDGSDAMALLPKLLPVYMKLLAELKEAGAEWVQIDEPFLALDLSASQKAAYKAAYAELTKSGLKLMLTTYFAGLRDNTELAFGLGTAGVHIDLVREPAQLDAALKAIKPEQLLSLGVVDGRNIWKTDFTHAIEQLNKAKTALGDTRIVIAPSCSLLHSPVDLAAETKFDDEFKNWLAYAQQKLEEIGLLAACLKGEKADKLAANKAAIESRAQSKRIHNAEVKSRFNAITPSMLERKHAFDARVIEQQKSLNLPLLPTTTIGSFPQTTDVREARAKI